MASHSSNSILKFADNTTVVGLVTNNDEMAYREEVGTLTAWCLVNNRSLNVSKTKELIVDFRRKPLWRQSKTLSSSVYTSPGS